MQQQCSLCSAPFTITKEDEHIYVKISPVIGDRTYEITPPGLCPECRQQRRYSFRNDQNYHYRNCHLCKKRLISIYSPDKDIPVLCDDCFWNDKWDPLAFGVDIDLNSSVFDLFEQMRECMPRLANFHTQSENCEYTVHSSRNRKCYMVSSCVDDEEVYYSDFTYESKNCIDLFSCKTMERSYECLFSTDCFQCNYVELCTNLSDCSYCFDCKSGQNLLGCTGMRNSNNMILNERCSPSAFEEKRKSIFTSKEAHNDFIKRYLSLKTDHPRRDIWHVQTENCTGNYIYNSKNVRHGFNVKHFEDAAFVYESHKNTDTYDVCRVAIGEMLYECGHIVDLSYSAFCNLTYQCQNLLYCDNCNGTRDSLLCMSMKKHQYCILNKQYTQKEYEELAPKIIDNLKKYGIWGEYFPYRMSPFGYNETKAMSWYPLTKEEVLKRGWNWSDYESAPPNVEKTIPAEKIPANIDDVPDDILHWAILCEETGDPFRIIPQELAFYRERGLTIPHCSPKERHRERSTRYNFRTLYKTQCGNCSTEIQTTFPPDRPEKVYCEECYLKEVY